MNKQSQSQPNQIQLIEPPTKPPLNWIQSSKLLNCGLGSGLLQACLFNPWDRALYLSVKYNRSFLLFENFSHPMAGVTQSVLQRAISSGLYFPLEEICLQSLYFFSFPQNSYQRSMEIFFAGIVAGSFNGLLLNPLSRIKVSKIHFLSFILLN